MAGDPYAVALVVDPAFGERLVPLAERVHVWIVDTPLNRAVAERIWAASRELEPSIERGITTFRAEATGTPESWAAAILPTIDTHHGEWSHTPPWSAVEVYGAALSDPLPAALREWAFTAIEAIAGGFRATKGGAG